MSDIAKPGETAATPTSRPIITNHTSIIKQDPMVAAKKEESAGDTDEETPGKISRKPELKLNPSNEEAGSNIPDGVKPEDKDKSNGPEDNVDEPPDKESDKPEKEGGDSVSETAAIDSLASSAENKKATSKENEEEQKKNEKIQELIASKKYAIPIIEGGHKATSQRFMSWLLLVLLVASAGIYLAIDTGYLDAGIALPYDLIKN